MWAGVVVAAAIIFVVWIAIIRIDLSSPSGSDSLFGRIKSEIQNLFTLGGTNSNTNAPDAELNDLRDRVFPVINSGSTVTTGNENTNTPLNVNRTGNTNQSSNINSALNPNTNF